MKKQKNNSYRLNYLFLFATLLLLAILKFSYHEFWKDEWLAWLIATDPPNLKTLFALLPAQGHPSLWYLFLRSVNFLANLALPDAPKEHVIQVFHFQLTAITFYLFFIRFRLNIFIKLGFALSYFLFFEYGVINRSYMPVCLLTFFISILSDSPKKNFLWIALTLFLLTQIEVYGIFIAAAFLFLNFTILHQLEKKFFTNEILALFSVFMAGTLLFYLTVSKTNHATGNSEILFNFSFQNLLIVFQSLYSNTFWIGLYPAVKDHIDPVNLIISTLVLSSIILIFRPQPKLLITYLIFFFSFLIFTTAIYTGGPRQWGLHLVFFIALLHHIKPAYQKKENTISFYLLCILTILFQSAHCLKIVKIERTMLFSNAINAGRYIKKTIPSGVPIIAINKAYATPVIGYSNHKFYSLPEKELFSYFVYDEKMYLPAMQEIVQFKEELHAPVMYVISYKPLRLESYDGLEPVLAFNNASIREESYFLYLVK